MAISRRSFLAAPIVYQVVDGGFKMKAASANDEVRLGFIGLGIRGTYLLESFTSVPGVRAVVGCDAYTGHLDRAKEITGGKIETTRDYRAVLDRKDIDAVVIATPDHWHHRMTLDALAADKHVFIEKPLTWSIPQGLDIIAAEKKSGKVLQVGSGAKTSTVTAKARELIQSGAIGKVNMVRMANNRNSAEGAWVYAIPPDASPETCDWQRFLGPAPKRAFDPKIFFRWRCWWEYSGGVTTDLFVHMLSQLHEVMNVTGPKSAVSLGGIYRWDDGRSVPDVMNSIYEYPNNFIADLYVNLGNARVPHGITIMGTERTLVLGGGNRGPAMTLYPEPVAPDVQRYGTNGWPKKMQQQYFESKGYTAEGRPREPLEQKKEQTVAVERGPQHHELFILSIRNGTPSKENATEGHFAAGAGHLANIAYRKGRRAVWDLKTSKVTEG